MDAFQVACTTVLPRALPHAFLAEAGDTADDTHAHETGDKPLFYDWLTCSLEDLWKTLRPHCVCPPASVSVSSVKSLSALDRIGGTVLSLSPVQRIHVTRALAPVSPRTKAASMYEVTLDAGTVEAVAALMGELVDGVTCVVFIMDVLRDVHDKDNHSSGLHINLMWLHAPTRTLRRYDPYYARTVKDTTEMQAALDRCCAVLAPPGWSYVCESIRVRIAAPFGPQLLDSCPSPVRETVTRTHGSQEFCVPWCLLAARVLMVSLDPSRVHNTNQTATKEKEQQHHMVSSVQVAKGVLAVLGLPLPMTLQAARGLSAAYFEAISRAAAGKTILQHEVVPVPVPEHVARGIHQDAVHQRSVKRRRELVLDV